MSRAVDLARRYAEALAALRAVHAFDAWLGEHWHERCAAPAAPPSARTFLGASGEITWYEDADGVVGRLPGQDGCFRIAHGAPLPDFLPARAAPPDPATVENDIVVSASMQDEPHHPGR